MHTRYGRSLLDVKSMGAPPGPTGIGRMVQSSLILDWIPLDWLLQNRFDSGGEPIELMEPGALDLPLRLVMADWIGGSRPNRDLSATSPPF